MYDWLEYHLDGEESFSFWWAGVGGLGIGAVAVLLLIGGTCAVWPVEDCTLDGIEARQTLAQSPVHAALAVRAAWLLANLDLHHVSHHLPAGQAISAARGRLRIPPVQPALPPESIRRRARPKARGKVERVSAVLLEPPAAPCELSPEGQVGLLEIVTTVGGTRRRQTYAVAILGVEEGHATGFRLLASTGKTYDISPEFGGVCDCGDCTHRERVCKHVWALKKVGELPGDSNEQSGVGAGSGDELSASGVGAASSGGDCQPGGSAGAECGQPGVDPWDRGG